MKKSLSNTKNILVAEKKITDTLKFADEYIRNVFMQAPAAIVVYKGPSFVVDLINEKALEMWDISYKKAINQPLFKIIPGLYEILEPFLTKAYISGEPNITKEFPMQFTHNGKLHEGIFNFVLSPICDGKGNFIGITSICTDVTLEITAHKRIVENQKKKALEFENAVKERTKELQKANEDLEKMNKELESFAYISSHDLQEPLRKTQIFADMILEKENQNLSETGKDYFLRIMQAGNRMQTLIKDLLAFSRLNSAERKFELSDLNKITEEVKAELKEVIEEKKAIIETQEMCDEIPIIRFQFRQLMHNLISNALKFSKADVPPLITIKSEILASYAPLGNDEKACHITITDNGIGFEERFSERIFQVFQKLHNIEEYPGTGIGLAIVKKIVENHKGIITATSELGQGSRFDVYIPVIFPLE